jgi:hypothetical protein
LLLLSIQFKLICVSETPNALRLLGAAGALPPDAFTVKLRPLDVPPGVVTVTVRVPVAADALIVIVAEADVALEVIVPTVMPVPVKLIELVFERLLPVIVRVKLVLCVPEDGDRELIEGTG